MRRGAMAAPVALAATLLALGGCASRSDVLRASWYASDRAAPGQPSGPRVRTYLALINASTAPVRIRALTINGDWMHAGLTLAPGQLREIPLDEFEQLDDPRTHFGRCGIPLTLAVSTFGTRIDKVFSFSNDLMQDAVTLDLLRSGCDGTASTELVE